MLALMYILLCMLTGYAVCSVCFPELQRIGEKSYSGKYLGLSSLVVAIPVYYFAGTLLVTWFVYLTAYIFATLNPDMKSALMPANMIAFFFFGALSAFLLFRKKKNVQEKYKSNTSIWGVVLLVLLVIFISKMMYRTFRVEEGELKVGYSVFSDFAVHLGMIRSFAFGNNFPTEYSHFAGEDIKYHFLFQFMVGNLNFLGMRLDHAFNIPSILSMVGACVLLYALAVKVAGKRFVGYLTVLFMLFRSSPSFFRYLAEIPKGENVWTRLKEQASHISYTPNEDWGLWNLKVYCNQRHLAFSLGVLFFALIVFMPYLYDMFARLRAVCVKNIHKDESAPQEAEKSENTSKKKETKTVQKERIDFDEPEMFEALCEMAESAEPEEEPGEEKTTSRFMEYAECFLFSKEAIMPKNIRFAVCMGVLLGCTAFWNGAVLIACLSVLFVMALCSSNRFDYLITAVIAVAMSMLESSVFIDGSAVSLKYYYGFIVPNRTFWGVSQYMFELWGMLLILVVVYAVLGKGEKRYLVFAFAAPLMIALYISMTPDVTVNHKFIMVSAMLLSLFPALIVDKMMELKRIGARIAAVGLIVVMTATGIFDYRVLHKLDENSLNYRMDDPLIEWVAENADADDIWLTPTYALHKVVLGGAMLYYGWPYYAWSAGYDTWGREEIVKQMYEAPDSATLEEMVTEYNIRYIVVDYDVRTNTAYAAREDVIAATYQAVYTDGDGDWAFTIYDTDKKW